jgi:hypothetical protein
MSGILNMWALEGSLERTEDTTHVVSLWYIPGGYDYINAKAVEVYFTSKETAEVFSKKWSSPPEMSFCTPIEEYNEFKERCKRAYEAVS